MNGGGSKIKDVVGEERRKIGGRRRRNILKHFLIKSLFIFHKGIKYFKIKTECFILEKMYLKTFWTRPVGRRVL